MLLAVLAVFLWIASLCGGKEAQIPQDLQCEFGKQALEETVDFKFIEGYRAPVEGVTLEHLKELHMNFSTYRCKADTLNYQYLTPDDRHFDGRKFLSALKDRTLAMVGDSLGIQTFNALDSEIHPLLVHEKKHKESHPDLWADIIGGEQVSWQRSGPRVKAARRDSREEWNTSIYFCNDPTLGTLLDLSATSEKEHDRDQVTYCARSAVEQAIRSDGVLVLTVGAWYKPHFDKTGGGEGDASKYPDTSAFTTDRFQECLGDFKKVAYGVRQSVEEFRRKLEQQGRVNGGTSRNFQVIWRLVSSSGHIAELDRAFIGRNGGHGFHHKNGYLWAAITEQMPPGDIPGFSWAAQFNAVLAAVAHHYHDYLLNSWTLSHHMIKFSLHPHMHEWKTQGEMESQKKVEFEGADRVQIHADSLHSCAGSVQRAEVLLLSELVEHKLRCQGV